mgnify:CR=1 FL=1
MGKKFMKLIRIVICIGFTFISGFIYAQSTDVDTEEVSQFDFANGLYSRQFFKEAIEEYKKFIANYPNSPRLGEAYLRLGKSALVEKQYEVAISAFDQAISRLSDLKRKTEAILGKGECFYYLKRWAESTEILKGLIDENTQPEFRVRALYFYARALEQTRNYETAINVLQTMIQNFPEHSLTPIARYILGTIYTKVNQLENAASVLSEVANDARIDKELRMESHFRVAEIYSQLGWYEGALNAYGVVKTQFKDGPYKERADFGYLWTLYQAKRFAEAVNEGKTFLQSYPNAEKRPFAMYILANSLLEQNQLDEALTFYNSLREQFPNTSYAVDAIYKTAWVKYLKNDYAGAKTDTLTFLDKCGESPLKPEGNFLLGSIYTTEGNYEDAMEEFQLVYEKYPDSKFAPEAMYKSAECAELLGITQSASQLYMRFIEKYPNHSLTVSAYLRSGDLHTKEGAYEKALDSYLKAKALAQNNPLEEQVFIRLAVCYERLNKSEEALQIYQEFINKFPQSQQSYDMQLKLGLHYLKEKKDTIKAIETLQKLLAQNPPPQIAGQVWHAIGIACYETKDYEKAAEALLKTVLDYPQVPMEEEQFAWLAQYYLDAQKWDESAKVLKRMQEVLKDYPAPQRLQYRYAECIQNLGRTEEAIQEYQKVVDMAPSSASATEALFRIAQIYEHGNQMEQALTFYEKCANNGGSETSARAQFRLSEIYESRGDYEKAGRNYLKVAILYLHPELSPESLWRSGQCYLKSNEKENAQRAFRELISDFPSHPLAEKAKTFITEEQANTAPLTSAPQ